MIYHSSDLCLSDCWRDVEYFFIVTVVVNIQLILIVQRTSKKDKLFHRILKRA